MTSKKHVTHSSTITPFRGKRPRIRCEPLSTLQPRRVFRHLSQPWDGAGGGLPSTFGRPDAPVAWMGERESEAHPAASLCAAAMSVAAHSEAGRQGETLIIAALDEEDEDEDLDDDELDEDDEEDLVDEDDEDEVGEDDDDLLDEDDDLENEEDEDE